MLRTKVMQFDGMVCTCGMNLKLVYERGLTEVLCMYRLLYGYKDTVGAYVWI